MLISADSINLNRLITDIMYKFLDILNGLSLTINPDKCKLVHFDSSNSNQLNIRINNAPVATIKSTKILGVVIDRNLSFEEHLRILTADLKKVTNCIKALSRKKSGAHPITLLRTFSAVVLNKVVNASLPITI